MASVLSSPICLASISFIGFLLFKAQKRKVIRQSKGNGQLECRAFSGVRVSERILIKAK